MKLTYTLLLVFLLLTALTAFSQPKLEVKNGTSFSFGDILTNTKATKDVTIKNTGKDTLHIKDVRAQCGCTATLLKEKVLAPDQEADLSITFNATGYRAGQVTKHVYIESDDPQTPTLTIEFQPNVIQLLDANPNMLSFNEAKIDTPIVKSLTIKNTSKDTITILSVNVSSGDVPFEYLKVALSKNALAPGDTTVLTGTLNTPKAGSYQASINLLTDNPNIPKYEVKSFMWVNRK